MSCRSLFLRRLGLARRHPSLFLRPSMSSSARQASTASSTPHVAFQPSQTAAQEVTRKARLKKEAQIRAAELKLEEMGRARARARAAGMTTVRELSTSSTASTRFPKGREDDMQPARPHPVVERRRLERERQQAELLLEEEAKKGPFDKMSDWMDSASPLSCFRVLRGC